MTDAPSTPTLVACTRKGCSGVLCAVHRGREVVAYRCDKCGRRIAVVRNTVGTESKR